MIKEFNIQINVKNDQLTQEAGDDIADILLDVLVRNMHEALTLPWVLGIEVDHAARD